MSSASSQSLFKTARVSAFAGERSVFAFFAAEICVVIFLQQVVIPGLGIEVGALLMPAGILALCFFSPVQFPLRRAVLYGLVLLFALISQASVHQSISTASFGLFLLAYLPLLVEVRVTEATYRRCLSFFQNLMLLACLILVIQHAWQLTLGWQSFPDMTELLPRGWAIQGFIHVQSLFYGSPYIKPNGFFFKEVAFLSQFLTLAFVIEMTFFMRYWRLAVYLGCLLATFAGTGLLVLLIVSPLLLISLRGRAAVLIVSLAIAIVFLAILTGWWDLVGNRISEFQTANTSGYARFTWPFLEAWRALSESTNLLSGIGAGVMQRRIDSFDILLPPVKLVIEYGPLVAIAFYAMFINATFINSPSRRLAATLFILYNLGGGFLLDLTIVNTVLLMGSILRPSAHPAPMPSREPIARRFAPAAQKAFSIRRSAIPPGL